MSPDTWEKLIFKKLYEANDKSKVDLSPSRFDSYLIFGTGELGRLGLSYCKSRSIKVKGFLVSQRSNHKEEILLGPDGEAYNVYSLDEENEKLKKERILISVATVSFEKLKKVLRAKGFENLYPFYQLASDRDQVFPLSNGWILDSFNEKDRKSVESVIEALNHDETSMMHYYAFIAWHVDYTEIESVNTTIKHGERYLIKPIIEKIKENTDNEYLDIGAHKGESVYKYLKNGILFSNYTLIDADENNMPELEKLSEEIHRLGSGCTVYNEIAHSKDGTEVYFQDNYGYCSRISEQKRGIKRKTISVDSLDIKPTVVKIHAEGSELQILRGLEATIKKYQPLIMVSAYHNSDGLYKLINQILIQGKNYKIYFRLHNYQGTGAFIYAIPSLT